MEPIKYKCQCEHIVHEFPNEAIHPDLQIFESTGPEICSYIGVICDDCAKTHMVDYLVDQDLMTIDAINKCLNFARVR